MKCILYFISYTDFFEMTWFTLCIVISWMYNTCMMVVSIYLYEA